MKRVLFIMSHPEADLKGLAEALENHPNICCFSTGRGYHHPDDLDFLTSQSHKRNNSAAIWADVILDNKDFTCQALVKCCDFLYWVQNPTEYRMVGLKQWHERTGGLWNPSLESDSFLETSFG